MIYLAAPEFADPDERQQQIVALARAARQMREAGDVVIAPAVHWHAVQDIAGELDADQVEQHYLPVLEACDALHVIMSPGWQGCAVLSNLIDGAHSLGLDIEFVEA
jgi:nucleoside 2-deoxyribosyltransferase